MRFEAILPGIRKNALGFWQGVPPSQCVPQVRFLPSGIWNELLASGRRQEKSGKTLRLLRLMYECAQQVLHYLNDNIDSLGESSKYTHFLTYISSGSLRLYRVINEGLRLAGISSPPSKSRGANDGIRRGRDRLWGHDM